MITKTLIIIALVIVVLSMLAMLVRVILGPSSRQSGCLRCNGTTVDGSHCSF